MKNVLLDFPCSKKYYLTHPWIFLRHGLSNLRSAWERATRGYCVDDVYNMDQWMLQVLGDAFTTFAEKNYGYPGEPPFDTFEVWQEWVKGVAATLHDSTEEALERRNEYKEEYGRYLDSLRATYAQTERGNFVKCELDSFLPAEEQERIRNLYFTRQQQLMDERDDKLRQTFNEIAANLFNLWI